MNEMPHKVSPDGNVWESEYSLRGPLWGGAVHTLPSLPPASRVLELGCGNGKTLAGMLRQGWAVVAVDLSPAAVMLAQKTIPAGYSCGLLLSDARSPPFKPRSFDAVFAWHLLGHLVSRDRVHCAEEIAHVLRPGGRFCFSEFSHRDFRFGSGREIEPRTFMRGTGVRTHYFDEGEVRDLFPSFEVELLEEKHWILRIRGKEYPRAEIRAVLVNPDG